MKYRSLDDRASDLGFPDYDAYLKSTHWRKFRRAVFRKTPQCRICHERANRIHHIHYERLGSEHFSDVVALCEECHDALHDAHRALQIPVKNFRQVAKLLARSRRQPKAPEKPVKPVKPPSSSVLPVHRHDLAHLARKVRKFLADGRSLRWMSKRLRCSKTQLAAMVTSIKVHG